MIIRYERKLEGLQEYTLKVKKHVDSYLNSLDKDVRIYNESERNFNKDLDNLKKIVANVIKDEVSKYYNSVRSNISYYTEDIFDYKEEEDIKEYVRYQIFEEDEIEPMCSRIIGKINKEYSKTFNYWKKASVIKEYENIDSIPYLHDSNSMVLLSNESRYDNIDFSYFGTEALTHIAAFGVAMLLLGPIGFVIAYFVNKTGFFSNAARMIAKKMNTPKIEKELKIKLDEICAEISKEINKEVSIMMDKLKKSIDKIRNDSFDRLYFDMKAIDGIRKTLNELYQINVINLSDVDSADIGLVDILGRYM